MTVIVRFHRSIWDFPHGDSRFLLDFFPGDTIVQLWQVTIVLNFGGISLLLQIKNIIQSGIDVPGNDNDLKKLQLQQLAELNGTFKPLDILK